MLTIPGPGSCLTDDQIVCASARRNDLTPFANSTYSEPPSSRAEEAFVALNVSTLQRLAPST
jgi:hypothetical protein